MMKFSMPLGGVLEVRSDPELDFDDEIDTPCDKKIEGVIWKIFWNDKQLPWYTETKLQAMALAFGCQYGAMQSHNHTAKKSNLDE
jgi:hypothetical protein